MNLFLVDFEMDNVDIAVELVEGSSQEEWDLESFASFSSSPVKKQKI